MEILATKATSLLTPLFDGMIWRSHLAHDGLRRGNYYIKHLVVDAKGKFPDAMENLVKLQNPQMLGMESWCFHPFFFEHSNGMMNPHEDKYFASSHHQDCVASLDHASQ